MSKTRIELNLKLKQFSSVTITPVFLQGSIESSLRSVFGEIGGQTELEIISLDTEARRAVVEVPPEFLRKARTAISLIGRYQDVPCHFQVHKIVDEGGREITAQ